MRYTRSVPSSCPCATTRSSTRLNWRKETLSAIFRQTRGLRAWRAFFGDHCFSASCEEAAQNRLVLARCNDRALLQAPSAQASRNTSMKYPGKPRTSCSQRSHLISSMSRGRGLIIRMRRPGLARAEIPDSTNDTRALVFHVIHLFSVG
jgi:hypothetical protein